MMSAKGHCLSFIWACVGRIRISIRLPVSVEMGLPHAYVARRATPERPHPVLSCSLILVFGFAANADIASRVASGRSSLVCGHPESCNLLRPCPPGRLPKWPHGVIPRRFGHVPVAVFDGGSPLTRSGWRERQSPGLLAMEVAALDCISLFAGRLGEWYNTPERDAEMREPRHNGAGIGRRFCSCRSRSP